MALVEPFAPNRTGFTGFTADLTATTLVNGLIGFIFAATGPVAIILTVGTSGGLSATEIASWVFGSFYINGLLSILACWLYRMPLVFFWSIPGAVLVGPALAHLSFPEVVGAFYATGLLMLLLGLSGWVRRAMSAIPMPIVMGMVAGVFLQFGLDWIGALRDHLLLAGAMTATFIGLTAVPSLGKRMPPLIGALIIGALVIIMVPSFNLDTSQSGQATRWFGGPLFVMPVFSWPAMLELVVPLAITVLAAQNSQGIAVLHNGGHQAPINFITSACGLWSMLAATAGSVSTCLTGPTNALISSSGPKSRHYAAGIVVGLLALVFGLFAPGATWLLLACPPAFVATLAGLAMLKVLQGAFTASFAGPFQAGALISFLITVSDLTMLNIGAPFWALVFGYAASRLLEKADHQKLAAANFEAHQQPFARQHTAAERTPPSALNKESS